MCDYNSSRGLGPTRLRVGRVVNLFVTTFKRKKVGRKNKGTVLFLKVLENKVMPERIENYYVCARNSETRTTYVRVEDMCTLLAEVADRLGDPTIVNLVPISHAFPVSWIA
jgi:hypothetical protein